jgi:hypothetical protein
VYHRHVRITAMPAKASGYPSRRRKDDRSSAGIPKTGVSAFLARSAISRGGNGCGAVFEIMP